MAGNFLETAGIKLRYLLGTSKVSDVDEGFQRLAEDCASKLLGYSEDTLAKRPSAGVINRHFRATDNGITYKDTGSGWEAREWPGKLQLSATAAAPEGWLLCDGSAVSRSTYALLFAAIATAYGAGDGSTTFNLPDYRETVPTGAGAAGRGLANARGSRGGAATIALSAAQSGVQDHTHSLGGYFTGGGPGNVGAAGGSFLVFATGSYAGVTAGMEGGAKNAAEAHSNAQPYQVSNVFIKT